MPSIEESRLPSSVDIKSEGILNDVLAKLSNLFQRNL